MTNLPFGMTHSARNEVIVTQTPCFSPEWTRRLVSKRFEPAGFLLPEIMLS